MEEARDGLYRKVMDTWMITGDTPIPVMMMDAIRNVVMGEYLGREWRKSIAMPMGSNCVMSYADYPCFRRMDAHETYVRFRGRFDEPTTISAPFYEFPMIPPAVADFVSPVGLSFRLPRVA